MKATYEDALDVIGEVRAADLDAGEFSIRLEDGSTHDVRFDPSQEEIVTSALKDHADRRLRIQGRGEFLEKKGTLSRILRVEILDLTPMNGIPFDPDEKPLSEVIAEIGARIPMEVWEQLPKNLSERVDEDLYGDRDVRS